jgi:hypothetical protein
VKDVLPTGLTFQSATPAASYDIGTGSWTIGSLAIDESATLTITATVNSGTEGTTITNYAQVSAANEVDLDSTPDNNPGPTSSEDDEDAVSTPVVTKGRPTITTSAVTQVTVGENIHDTATISGLVNPDGTGSITFTLYSDVACTNQVFADTVSSISANGDYVSANHTATAVGSYYWIASFSGDSNNDPIETACLDEGETSVVNKATPSISTTPDPSSGTIGVTLNDSAALSGGFNPMGDITFNLYAPSDPTCAGTPAFTDVVSVNGNGAYSTSSGFASNAGGVWRWTATYSGDGNNNSVSSGCDAEQVTITQAVQSQITPTATTCSQFASGSAATLSELLYTVKSGKVGSVSPGVFFYWVKVTVASSGNKTFTINQATTTSNFDSHFFNHTSGTFAYTSGCTKINTSINTSSGVTSVTFNASAPGTYIIGIKYDSKSVQGFNTPSPTTVHYDFSTTGVSGSTQGLDLKKKS